MFLKNLSAMLKVSVMISALALVACGGGGSAEEGAQPQDGGDATSETNTEPQFTSVTLPESTVIEITLIDSIDTDEDVAGDTFMAELAAPLMAGGTTVFKKGAKVVGKLDKVVESGRMKTPAELTISLVSIEAADGEAMSVDAYPLVEKMDSHTKKQVGLIGGGAIIGGAIGKITGKEGGTEIGIAAGAAAGAAAAAATGKQDIEHPPGTKAGFFLRTPITLKVPA